MINFYIIGDMGTGNFYQKKVAQSLFNHIKEKKDTGVFICGLGDNIYEKGCRVI